MFRVILSALLFAIFSFMSATASSADIEAEAEFARLHLDVQPASGWKKEEISSSMFSTCVAYVNKADNIILMACPLKIVSLCPESLALCSATASSLILEQCMENTRYFLYPPEYGELVEDWSSEFSALGNNSQRLHDLLPKFPATSGLKIELVCPSDIKIYTNDPLNFSWDDVQFPISFISILDNRH